MTSMTATTTKVFFNVSEIATLIGQARWSRVDTFNAFWSRNMSEYFTFYNTRHMCLCNISNSITHPQKAVSSDIRSDANKAFGIINEPIAISAYTSACGDILDTSQQLYVKHFHTLFDTEYYIRGRLDGIHKESKYIVEVKNRVSRLFKPIPDYEKTQVHMYMHLTDIHTVRLVQRLDNTNHVTEMYYEPKYFEYISDLLKAFIVGYTTFINDPYQTLKYLATDDTMYKESVIDRMLTDAQVCDF